MNDANEIDYGPLRDLIGTWWGDKGLDIAPEPDGAEESPYYETWAFEGAGCVENAESQRLVVVRYHQTVSRKSNDEVFHDQVGYWTWDAASGTLAHSFTIPRAVCVLAGGSHAGERGADGGVTLLVRAELGDEDWGIVQSPFMRDKARTLSFAQELVVGEERLAYTETTRVEIYGRTFEHVDSNELVRRADATA